MHRVKFYNSYHPGADYRWVVIPTHWKVVAKGNIKKGARRI